jgi:hypothetical protein
MYGKAVGSSINSGGLEDSRERMIATRVKEVCWKDRLFKSLHLPPYAEFHLCSKKSSSRHHPTCFQSLGERHTNGVLEREIEKRRWKKRWAQFCALFVANVALMQMREKRRRFKEQDKRCLKTGSSSRCS